MTSSDAATIRVAVVGDWVPSQLADVLALQRSQEPETTAALVACSAAVSVIGIYRPRQDRHIPAT